MLPVMTNVRETGSVVLFMRSGAKIEISNESLLKAGVDCYEKLLVDGVFSVGYFIFNGKDIEVISY